MKNFTTTESLDEYQEQSKQVMKRIMNLEEGYYFGLNLLYDEVHRNCIFHVPNGIYRIKVSSHSIEQVSIDDEFNKMYVHLNVKNKRFKKRELRNTLFDFFIREDIKSKILKIYENDSVIRENLANPLVELWIENIEFSHTHCDVCHNTTKHFLIPIEIKYCYQQTEEQGNRMMEKTKHLIEKEKQNDS